MAKTLLEVLNEQGVETYEKGDKYVAHCPFHEGDREPSFTIYTHNETYYCFGCAVWGNPVKFMIEYKGMNSQEALDYVGIDYKLPKAEKRVIKLKNLAKTARFLYEIAEQYHVYLKENQGPQKYLYDRGLTTDTIDKFKLGYTDGAVLNLQFAEEYELANEIGLLSKNGYESLSHRITIPNIVDNNYADFMIGRTVINDKIKYLGVRMPKPICGFYESRNSPILFLVEGNFDYLILRQWGYPAIVMSGSHLSAQNLMLLRGKQVVYIPDNDDTGFKAAAKIKKELPSTIVIDYRNLGVKDIGELALKDRAKESFEEIVSEALWDTRFWNPTSEISSTTLIDTIPSPLTLSLPA